MSEQQTHLKESIELREVAAAVSSDEESTAGEARQQYQADNFNRPRLDERFELLEPIGEGAMAYVWKVKDHSIDQILALKLLRKDLTQDPEAVSRFQQEARLSMELQHPHIAAVYEPGFDLDNRPYILMDFVPGQSLQQLLKQEGKLAEDRAMFIFKQICQALTYAHMHGVVHRDIKPSNIMISTAPSGADFVKVVDFGIARSIHEEVHNTQALTRPLGDFATPRYMSPEQCLGQKVTAQSDIYSLGCVLHEMISGMPPFTETNQVRLIMQHLSEAPNLRNFSKSIGPILAMMLEKNLGSRLESLDHIPETTENSIEYFEVGLGPAIKICSVLSLIGIGVLVTQTTVFFPTFNFSVFAFLATALFGFWFTLLLRDRNNCLQKSALSIESLCSLTFYSFLEIGILSALSILQRVELISSSIQIAGSVITTTGLIVATICLKDSKTSDWLTSLHSRIHKSAFTSASNANFKSMIASLVAITICLTIGGLEESASFAFKPMLLIGAYVGVLFIAPLLYFFVHTPFLRDNLQFSKKQSNTLFALMIMAIVVPTCFAPTFYSFNPHLVRPDRLALEVASDLINNENNKFAIPGLIDRFLTKHEITTRKDFENTMRALEMRIVLAQMQHDTAAVEQYTDRMIIVLQNQIKRESALNPTTYAQSPPEPEIERLLYLRRGKNDLTQLKISKMIRNFVETLPEVELNKWPALKAQYHINNTRPGKRS